MSRKPPTTTKLRFEPLERRELLAVTASVTSGHALVIADAAGDQVDISYDGTDWHVDSDNDATDNDAIDLSGVTGDFTVILREGADVTFHTATQESGEADARLQFPGNLVIVGSTLAQDIITFTDDATGGQGGAQIGGDFLFTGQGGGDDLIIEAPAAGDPTTVDGHVTIDMGSDSHYRADVEIDGLDQGLNGNFSLSTGAGATVELKNLSLDGGNVRLETQKVTPAGVALVDLENVDTGGGQLKLSTGPAEDRITFNQVATGGGELVLLSDAGQHSPGGPDTVTLNGIDLDDGNLTMQTGAGADVVAVDAIMTTGDFFIDLGRGPDRLNIGQNAPSEAKNLWIRGRTGADKITVQDVTTTKRLGVQAERGPDLVRVRGTVNAGSMVINTGRGHDTLRLAAAINVPGANQFRANGGPGKKDKTRGESVLPEAYARRFFMFEDRKK